LTLRGVENMISDAGDYAGKKGKEAMDNMRGVGDTLAVAIERSVTTNGARNAACRPALAKRHAVN
jgi:hypothetical protein